MRDITPAQFNSTTYILEHNWTLNHHTVPTYPNLVAANNDIIELVKGIRPTHWLSKWLVDNLMYEVRRYDCLHHPTLIDSDPIPEIFPQLEMSYIASVIDPYTAAPLMGVTDPTQLKKLYTSKFGPGTPQSFLCEHVILGWVMYYDHGDYAWIVEVQANNTLSGGILSQPSNRRHFYRHLLSVGVMYLNKPCVLLTANEMLNLHQRERAGRSMPPQVPYHHDVVHWCGMARSTIGTLPVTSPFTPSTTVWHTFPSA